MTNNLKRQVEVQGTKKLDNLKGVQVLELKEMKETDGGFFGFNWGLFWRGATIGVASGAAGAAAYYASA